MPRSELVRFLKHEAGEYLRGVVRHHRGSMDMLYLRSDIREYRLQSQVDRMLTRIQPESHTAEEKAFPFGDLHATVRLFDDATIIHLPTGSRRGIVVSLDPGAARDLASFASRCLDHIET